MRITVVDSCLPSATMDPLQEQCEYYRERAPDYDQWWRAEGRYAKSPLEQRRWFDDVDEVSHALDEFAPAGDVLELAAARAGGRHGSLSGPGM